MLDLLIAQCALLLPKSRNPLQAARSGSGWGQSTLPACILGRRRRRSSPRYIHKIKELIHGSLGGVALRQCGHTETLFNKVQDRRVVAHRMRDEVLLRKW